MYSEFFEQLFQNIIYTDHPFSFTVDLWKNPFYLIKQLQNAIYFIFRYSYPILTTDICDRILNVIFPVVDRL